MAPLGASATSGVLGLASQKAAGQMERWLCCPHMDCRRTYEAVSSRNGSTCEREKTTSPGCNLTRVQAATSCASSATGRLGLGRGVEAPPAARGTSSTKTSHAVENDGLHHPIRVGLANCNPELEDVFSQRAQRATLQKCGCRPRSCAPLGTPSGSASSSAPPRPSRMRTGRETRQARGVRRATWCQ